MRWPWRIAAGCAAGSYCCWAAELNPTVEVEEEVYSYSSADNGAGPMWCAGSTCLVRSGERVFATGLETIPGAKPLNNCRWVLFERTGGGWKRIFTDRGRTREPSPLAAFHDGRVIVSGNPTTTRPDVYSGPAQPELWEFAPKGKPVRILPEWSGSPPFSEHSYRSLAADGAKGEFVLFQNIGYRHAEWCFRDAAGAWPAQGRLEWPKGSEYDPPQPVRLCYPNVALKDRAVHFFGVGDITEPVEEWRRHKEELTGRKWDYVFRRLYYTWTPDIVRKPFRPWSEISNREETAGHLWPCDMYLDEDGSVHLLWTERAIDERLRENFFPEARQSQALNYAVLRQGKTVRRQTFMESSEEKPGLVASRARFHPTADGRLMVVMHVSGKEDGTAIAENRIAEIGSDGTMGAMHRLPLNHPISSFFTATPRAGSSKSNYLELFGPRSGKANTMSYVRVRLF